MRHWLIVAALSTVALSGASDVAALFGMDGRIEAQVLRPELRTQVEAEVKAAEKALEEATEKRDVETLRRLYSDNFVGTNQWGATGNKDGNIAFHETDPNPPQITLENSRVTLLANVAVIAGSKIAARPRVRQAMLYTSVWTKAPTGAASGGATGAATGWQLFSYVQFWDPRRVLSPPQGSPTPNRLPSTLADRTVEAEVMTAERKYLAARTNHDPVELERAIFDLGLETDQKGATRTKAALIEFHKNAPLRSVATSDTTIHGQRDLAVVVGRQAETGPTGIERLVFSRTWIETDGSWQLFASTQFPDPGLRAARGAPPPAPR